MGEWKPIPFAQEAQKHYLETLSLVENGQKAALKRMVTTGLYYPLAEQLQQLAKKKKKVTDIPLPEVVEFVERPRVVHKALIETAQDAKQEVKDQMCQVTIRTVSLQRSRKTPKAEPVKTVEFLVMERVLTDPKDHWKLAGIFPRHKDVPSELDTKDPFGFY